MTFHPTATDKAKWQNIDAVVRGMGNEDKTQIICRLLDICYSDKVDGKTVWTPEKEINGGDLVDEITQILEARGLTPPGPIPWD